MSISINLTWVKFSAGIAILFSLLFLLNYNLYVMPDALTVTAGSLTGTSLFTWLGWKLTKFKMKERSPEFKIFFLSIASLLILTSSFSGILKLLG